MVSFKKILKLGTLSSIIILLLIIAFLGPLFTVMPPTIKDSTHKSKTIYYTSGLILPQNQTDIWVERIVYVSEFWYIRVMDTINISNRLEKPFNGLIVYYPMSFWKHIDQFILLGSYKEDPPRPLKYSVLYLSMDYVAIRILFYTALTKYSDAEHNSFRIYIDFYMNSLELLEFKFAGDKIFALLNITPGPYLNHYVNKYVTMIYSPDDPTISLESDRIKPTVGKEIVEDRIVKYTKSNIKPMNITLNATQQLGNYGFDEEIQVVWSLKNGTPVIKFAHRIIEIDEAHRLKIHDHLVVSLASFYAPELNPKKTKMILSELRVGLASNITNIAVRDNIGKLSYGNTTDKDITSSIHVIRIDLKTRPLTPGDIRDIYIDYELILNDKFLVKDTNTFNVSIPLAPAVNTSLFALSFTIKTSLPTKIILPIAYKERTMSHKLEKFFLVQFTNITYAFEHVLPHQNKLVILLIDYAPIPLIRTYLLLTLYTIIASVILLEVLFIGRAITQRIMAPSKIKVHRDLEKFLRAYETIIAYDKNLWGDTYNNLLIKRPTPQFLDDFTKRTTNLHQQYLRLISLIEKLKKEPPLYEYLIELEKTEEFIKLLKTEIINLTKDFLSGKVPTNIFKMRIEALLLELKDQINHRERIINTLRDYYLALE